MPDKARQLDLSLPVVICAWCKPKDLGSAQFPASHGICPGHLRKIKFELQGIVAPPRRPSRRRAEPGDGLLPL